MTVKRNCAASLLNKLGWQLDLPFDLPNKCVLCIAPHTSNWDFFYGLLFKKAVGLKAYFFMKKEWFRFPLGNIMRAVGGIPVDRSKKSDLTEQMAAAFKSHEEFCIGVTPEATRQANPNWKKGFYFIALKAQVPIVLAYFDYEKKKMGFGKMLMPSGDLEKDMQEIKNFYTHIKGKKPENFAI